MAAQSHYSCEAGCSSCKKYFGLERDSPPDPRSECRQSIRLQQKHGSGIGTRISDYDSFYLSVSLGTANAPRELSILLRWPQRQPATGFHHLPTFDELWDAQWNATYWLSINRLFQVDSWRRGR